MNNIVQQFQAICGEYNMNKMVAHPDGSWTASLWRGARRIGTVMYTIQATGQAIDVKWNQNRVTILLFNPEAEDKMLTEWADKAGPYGFDGPEDFVMHLFKWAQMLIEMRDAVRKGHLVAYALNALDPHDMPIHFSTSKNTVTDTWISGYTKTHKNMQVVNHAVT